LTGVDASPNGILGIQFRIQEFIPKLATVYRRRGVVRGFLP
jgi:hypothetical protein